jgi:histidine triad (HIT) family protein
MPSIFSRIVSGEIPAYKIAETEDLLAFLDVFPLRKGHVLVIPKKEIDHLFSMPQQEYLALFEFTHQIAQAIHKAFPDAKKIGLAVIGLEVPHAHIHLVPINDANDLNFTQTKLTLSKDELEEIANRIRKHL